MLKKAKKINKKIEKSLSHSYSPDLCVAVGDSTGGTIRCLGADKFQSFVRVSWKKEVFVRSWEL